MLIKTTALNTLASISPHFLFCWWWNALQGLGKGAHFSLYLTQKYFSRVASALGKNDNQLSTVSLEFLPFRFFHHVVAFLLMGFVF
ncbi:unnamed protein product [Prunus brigantina]